MSSTSVAESYHVSRDKSRDKIAGAYLERLLKRSVLRDATHRKLCGSYCSSFAKALNAQSSSLSMFFSTAARDLQAGLCQSLRFRSVRERRASDLELFEFWNVSDTTKSSIEADESAYWPENSKPCYQGRYRDSSKSELMPLEIIQKQAVVGSRDIQGRGGAKMPRPPGLGEADALHACEASATANFQLLSGS